MLCAQRKKQRDQRAGCNQILCQVSNFIKVSNELRENLYTYDIDLLKSEVKINQALDHPNIVRFVEFCEDERYYLIVMELMDGGNVSFRTFFL